MAENEEPIDEESRHMLETVTMFEQILEVMPGDEMALRALYDAYSHLDRRDQAFEMLNRLTEIALDTEEYHLGDFLVSQYSLYEDLSNSRSVGLRERLSTCLLDMQQAGAEASTVETKNTPLEVGPDDRKDAELSLAWELYQDGLLQEEDYTMVVQDITEMLAKDVAVPVTVLHVLSDRRFTHYSAVVTWMAQKSGSPFISLRTFEIGADLQVALPSSFIQKNAALCFKSIGGELLIAVLNPFDTKLIKTVASMVGRTVHPYLIDAEEFDEYLKDIQEIQKTLSPE